VRSSDVSDDSLICVRAREARHEAWLAEMERVDHHSLEGSLAALVYDVAFETLVPGHHLQIAIANEHEGLPALSHLSFNSGFTEGWALYAERSPTNWASTAAMTITLAC
jgi:uncharacterized protein (DUF885 family)